jgi:hypothetical protein
MLVKFYIYINKDNASVVGWGVVCQIVIKKTEKITHLGSRRVYVSSPHLSFDSECRSSSLLMYFRLKYCQYKKNLPKAQTTV